MKRRDLLNLAAASAVGLVLPSWLTKPARAGRRLWAPGFATPPKPTRVDPWGVEARAHWRISFNPHPVTPGIPPEMRRDGAPMVGDEKATPAEVQEFINRMSREIGATQRRLRRRPVTLEEATLLCAPDDQEYAAWLGVT